MTASGLFEVANLFAMAGWLVLAAGVLLQRPWLRGSLADTAWPLTLSAAYSGLVLFFFINADGGFDSLENVRRLFASDWMLLAGWIHYLAFDLFIGAWIAHQVLEERLPRWLLVGLLPLTFLFGPAGLLAFYILKGTLGAAAPANTRQVQP